MKLPEKTKYFEGELGTYWFDDEGYLYSLSNKIKRTVQNVKENVELIRSISGNKKVCLIVYVVPSPVPDRETRDYVTKELPNIYSAMAIISKNSLGKVIMNFLFKLRPPVIPMKTFSNEAEAKNWIKQFHDKNR